MPRVAYVNGRYESLADAAVNVEDRGYQFADGIYEVCLLVDGRFWDEDGHFDRMERSLSELSMSMPMSRPALKAVIAALLRKNRLKNALVYVQVTRGVAARNHAFPPDGTVPSIVITAKPYNLAANEALASRGVGVLTMSDQRWARVDIKTVSLLPNCLAKQAAREAGAFEAWLVRDGKVTEGASSNAWIVNGKGELITHPLGHEILGGITRQTAIRCAEEMQMKVVERAFTVAEAQRAHEAFITAATLLVMPVVSIDGRPVGSGKPGPVAQRLREAYLRRCSEIAGERPRAIA
jgi:D-alanine transaminase